MLINRDVNPFLDLVNIWMQILASSNSRNNIKFNTPKH